jgi:2-oxo-4-hydroxy-4-carboxy--5-ureidoimidazoline (OHCU) decarboxylase
MAATNQIPPITTLPSLGFGDQSRVLDLLFEPSPELQALSVQLLQEPYTSYAALIDVVGKQLTTLAQSKAATSIQRLDAILGAHPRLGDQKTESTQSRAEQAQLQHGAAGEVERLAALNAKYEARFPGLRYVVFVNGRGRDVIMEDMQKRIARGDIRTERADTIQVS